MEGDEPKVSKKARLGAALLAEALASKPDAADPSPGARALAARFSASVVTKQIATSSSERGRALLGKMNEK